MASEIPTDPEGRALLAARLEGRVAERRRVLSIIRILRRFIGDPSGSFDLVADHIASAVRSGLPPSDAFAEGSKRAKMHTRRMEREADRG